MRDRLQRFMAGRYGADELARTLSAVALVCILLSMFVPRGTVFGIIYWIGIALLMYNCYRMFSRDVARRYAENQQFLALRSRAARKVSVKKQQWEQRDIYRFYKCPDCKQKVRVPKGRGKICITCPKCSCEFIKKS